MADPVERIVEKVLDFVQPQALAERLNLGPIGVLLFTRFSGPALLGAARWARRHPTVALSSAVAAGAAWYFLQQQNRPITTAHAIAAT
jgi:hypothetical protein